MPTTAWQLNRIITRGRRFIPEVDGLRFIAISAVVFFHLSGHTLEQHMVGATVRSAESWIPRICSIGNYGVPLFFVLSGFLLATPFAKWRLGLGAKPSLRTYYLRRLTRLEPPYIVLMLVIFVGGLFVFGATAGLSRWPNLLASLLYQHNLVYGTGSLMTIVAWSLEIEVQFYCLAPFLAVVFSIPNVIARRGCLLAVMLAVPFARSFVSPEVIQRFNSLPVHLEFFIAGFFLADVFLLDWKEAPIRSFAWDLLSVIAWPLLMTLMLWKRFPLLIAPLVLVAYLGAFKGKASSWIFSRPLITTIGGMCYSMYLVHYKVISITGRISKRILLGSNFVTRFAIDALFAIPAILLVTGIFFVIVERPCMDPRWLDKAKAKVRGWTHAVEPQEEATAPAQAESRSLPTETRPGE